MDGFFRKFRSPSAGYYGRSYRSQRYENFGGIPKRQGYSNYYSSPTNNANSYGGIPRRQGYDDHYSSPTNNANSYAGIPRRQGYDDRAGPMIYTNAYGAGPMIYTNAYGSSPRQEQPYYGAGPMIYTNAYGSSPRQEQPFYGSSPTHVRPFIDSQSLLPKRTALSGNTLRNRDENQRQGSYGIDKQEWRIVLIGKTGVGKSATGNSILGQHVFHSELSPSSVTLKTDFGEAERFGKKLLVVDTPGIFDTRRINSETNKEISKCISLASPGFHAIILVLRLGRFTEEERNTVNEFVNLFGPQLFNFMAIVFTYGDDLRGEPIYKYVEKLEPSSTLSEIIRKCGNRYVVFNNNLSGQNNTEQVRSLLSLIKNLISSNGSRYYQHETFKQAEAILRRKHQEERNRKEKMERKRLEAELAPIKFALSQERQRNDHLGNQISELKAHREKQETYVRKREEEFEEELRRIRRRNEEEDERKIRQKLRKDIVNEKPGVFSSVLSVIAAIIGLITVFI